MTRIVFETTKVPDLITRLVGEGFITEREMNTYMMMFCEGQEVTNERISKTKRLEKHDIGSNEQGSSSRSDQV